MVGSVQLTCAFGVNLLPGALPKYLCFYCCREGVMPKAQWNVRLILKSFLGTAAVSALALGSVAVAQEFNTEQ